MCSNSNKGVLLFPQCIKVNSNEDTCIGITNYSSKKYVKLLENVIQTLDLNSELERED